MGYVFNLSRDLEKGLDWGVMWLYGEEPVVTGHQPVKSFDHGDSDNGDIMVLFCHFVLQSHPTKRSSKFMGRRSSM